MSTDTLPNIGPLDECGPDAAPEAPTYHRPDASLSDWLAGERIDWGAETQGPLTQPRTAPAEQPAPLRPLPFPTQETT